MDTLYFHNLPRAPEGAYLASEPLELADLVADRWGWLQRDEPEPEPTIPLVGFIVKGPERVDRYGLMVRRSDLHGTPEDNVDSIRRTMPDGWEVVAREATV